MDFEEIKKIIELDGGKFIIVENGKPIMVIISFDHYRELILKDKTKKEDKNEVLDKSFEEKKEEMKEKVVFEDLTIDDLPV